MRNSLLACLMVMTTASAVAAQQRPLVTEDPEPIGAGRVLVEAGLSYSRNEEYPVAGLEGNLWRVGDLGLSLGVSSIAEVQMDWGLRDRLAITKQYPAPLSHMLTITGTTTSDFADSMIGAKTRLLSETARRPALGMRFATKLPNASNEQGLGLDTIDFFTTLLAAKTVQSVRVVGNVGMGILSDPTTGNRQNDVLLYGFSFARAMTPQAELVGELNGRVSTRKTPVIPGTETRGLLRLGGRYTSGPVRADAAMYFGLTSVDPTIGFTVGATYVFNGFSVP